jgi:hypothetical protein
MHVNVMHCAELSVPGLLSGTKLKLDALFMHVSDAAGLG